MRCSFVIGLTCAAFSAGFTAASPQSMMGVPAPAASSSTPADATAAPEPAAPKAKQKVPPGALTVINASTETVTGVVITAGDKTATLAKPLAPKARTAVKLPKIKGCTVSVVATFT